ncbi:unnamed protein product [Cladocopium goreaui]|uniref:Uncharacterized protein n=1 Tax=Cladocopium goreaui TaxID=2562237 RepID=A0A9P1C0N0_9DINO|nr:unnamed protein product [Cladocopium goreaui]
MQLGDLCYYHDSQNRQQQCCIWSVRLDGMCQIGSSRFDRPSTEHWIPTSRLVRLDSSPFGPVGAVEPLTKANVRAHTVASAGAPTVVSAATVINGDQRSRSPKSRAPFRERRCRVKVTVNDTVEEALKRAEFYGTVKSHFQEEGSLYVRFLHTNSAQKAVSTWKGAQWA